MANPPIISQRPPREKPKRWTDGHDHAGLLPGLNDVNWSSVRHAYGPAIDIPAQLLAVAQDGALANDATSELFGNIHHQGSVYEATAVAVPFLAELACRPIRQRMMMVVLLGLVANGRPRGGPVHAAVLAAAPRVLSTLASETDLPLRGALVGLAAVVGPAAATTQSTLRAIVGPPLLAAGAQLALRRVTGVHIDGAVLAALSSSDEELREQIAEMIESDGPEVGDGIVDLLDVLMERLASQK